MAQKISHNLSQTGFSGVYATFSKKIITENWGGGIKIILYFTEYIGFIWLFGLLLEGQLSDFTGYMEYFRLFDISPSCREVKMIDFTDYIWFIRLFDFLTSWWEVKMIDFIEYIDFLTFRLFDLLVGSLSDHFY